MSLVEYVPNPNAAASADFESESANGMAADFVRGDEGSAIDDGSRDFEQGARFRTHWRNAACWPGIRFQAQASVCWPILREDRSPCGLLILRTPEHDHAPRMMVWPAGSHDRYQAEETNPVRHRRNRMLLNSELSERTRIATFLLERMPMGLSISVHGFDSKAQLAALSRNRRKLGVRKS